MILKLSAFLHSMNLVSRGKLILFAGGFTMLMTQVVLLRELASLYVVNELIVGVFLSFWLLFSGLGAFMGSRLKHFNWRVAGFFPLLLGIGAFGSLWLLYLMRGEWMPVGVVPGMVDWIAVVVATTLFFCFLSGLMFTWFSGAVSQVVRSRQTEYVYIFEQAGSLLAGILFYLLSNWWLNAFWVMSLLLIINVLLALVLFYPQSMGRVLLWGSVAVLVLAGLLVVPQYHLARSWVHGESVKRSFFSAHGSFDVLEKDGQERLFGSGRYFSFPLLSQEREELLHPALLLHPDPRRLLLINLEPGLAGEALRYDSMEVFFVSPDQALLTLEWEMLRSDQEQRRIHFVHADPVSFLSRKLEAPFDVVVVGGGVPYTLAGNRFCTKTFFSQVRDNLRPNGIVMIGGVGFAPFWSPHRAEMLRVFHSTLASVFSQVKVWAGGRVFFLGSDSPFVNDWWRLHPVILEGNEYVCQDYFPGYLLESQIKEVMKVVAQRGPENSRTRPVLFRLALKDLSSFWDVNLWWFVGILGLLFFCGLISFRGVSSGVFITGFALGGMQVLLMLVWQLVRGNLFRATGLLFSLFMAGLALGAWIIKRVGTKGGGGRLRFALLLWAMAVVTISALPVLNLLGDSAWFAFFLSVGVVLQAFLGGAVFASALALQKGSVTRGAALVYGADVAGGAIGSFVVAIFMVPFLGLINAGYLIGLMLLVSGLFLMKRLD